MGGPVEGRDTIRAGDDGEYHHSKNFTKNMAVGRRTLKESSRSLGDFRMRARSVFNID